MPGFDFSSRISLRATRLDPTFAAATLFIFGGKIASPSSRAAAFDNTISWISVSFAMMDAPCFDSSRCHAEELVATFAFSAAALDEGVARPASR